MKRQRLAMIEASVKQMIGQLLRQGVDNAATLCRREVVEALVHSLDEQWTRKTLRRLRRDRRGDPQAPKADIAEVYSQPRLTKVANEMGMDASFALDLVTGWDFTVAKQREDALRMQDEQAPWMVMLSPPCCPFSSLQRWNYPRMPEEKVKEPEEKVPKPVEKAKELE